MGDLGRLDDLYTVHRKAQRFIYDIILRTLKVGSSMHYARNVKFGAGLHLLNSIVADNRQTTTRSLMAIFSTLLSIELRQSELFESFSRRMDGLIQRLRGWRPPVILPEQLLLFCALRALPDVPYGPVRHIILASPNVGYRAGMHMLKDVANTGAELIKTTLGSDSSSAMKPASVLCSSDCTPDVSKHAGDDRRGQPNPRRGRRTTKKKRGPSKLCQQHGPCKHHGPNSFHATSECKDPTLARRKAAKSATNAPVLAGVAAASVPEPQSGHSIDVRPIFADVCYQNI